MKKKLFNPCRASDDVRELFDELTGAGDDIVGLLLCRMSGIEEKESQREWHKYIEKERKSVKEKASEIEKERVKEKERDTHSL